MNWFAHFRYWLCRHICPDMMFNSDMSLELDQLQQRNDQLEEHSRGLLSNDRR